MANFLHNLAARTVEPAHTVRPRLASLFEPIYPGPVLDQPAAIEALLDVPDAPASAHAQPSIPPPARVFAPPAISAQPADDVPNALPARARPPHIAPAATVVPAPSSVPQPAPARDAQPEAPRAVMPAAAIAPVSAHETSMHKNAPAPQTMLQPAPPPVSYAPALPSHRPSRTGTEQSPATINAPQPAAPRTIIERMIERATRPVERSTQPAPAMLPARQTAPPAAHTLSELATTAPPTINVTIGRIEVRATQGRAPAQAQRSAPEVMSLEEYLRRRSRGGGR